MQGHQLSQWKKHPKKRSCCNENQYYHAVDDKNLKNGHTRGPLTIWNTFVNVQLHTPGDTAEYSAWEWMLQKQILRRKGGNGVIVTSS